MIDAPIQRGPGFIRACSVRLAVPLALALFAAGALVSRFYPGPPPDARTAKTVNDSIVYLYMAQTDWTDTALWRGLKPPAVPVWYHALDATPERLGIAPVFQTFFSAIAWITLGLILASTLRSLPLKIILFCIYAALFAFPPVFGWNKYVLSESLALSWMILFLSAFIAFWRYGALPEAVCLTAAAIGCGLAKDTHALLVAAMILPLAWNALVRQKKYPDQGRYP
ncbi:MAG: hypothetical protein PHP98_02130, partial [Kiritimatiellae bacterium]|nr:hypothetical protein [Kiritimatiellia bacterium]